MKIKRKATNVVIYVFVTLVSLSAIVPLLYVLLTSLKTSGQIYDVNQIVPTSFTLENYINVLYKAKFLTYFRNSVIVAVCTTVVCMVLSICAGYGMTRYRVRGSQKLKMGILYTRMFPSVLLALPYYVIMRNLDLGDSLLGLILIYCSFTLPFYRAVGTYDGITGVPPAPDSAPAPGGRGGPPTQPPAHGALPAGTGAYGHGGNGGLLSLFHRAVAGHRLEGSLLPGVGGCEREALVPAV